MGTAPTLAEYNRKRDFAKTREPRGEAAQLGGNRFIVQKHDATRLHYDFRLEMDGVLKSWAVTKGPSPDPADKRLAVRTEDHPLSYAEFEGTIPEGEYGGGTVMLWDKGTWAPVPGKKAKDLEKGHLHFTLDGERMKGEWLLVRLKPRPGEKRENWLLRKVEDDYVGGADELVEKELTSVSTGRNMEEIARGMKPAVRKAVAKGQAARLPIPKFRKPQLATLVDHVPPGNGWLHEVKYDGYRCLLAIGSGAAKAWTRSGLDWSDKFQGIVEAGKAIRTGSALLDGEIVWLNAEGRPDFSGLQARIKAGGQELIFFAFDLLEQDGDDLTKLPNIERKQRLRALIGEGRGVIRYADHIVGHGEKLLRTLCKSSYEGIISKKADAVYAGRRGTAWLKIKCTQRQEFVIIGWTKSEAKGRPFSSLVLAQKEGSELRYTGRVGTGFDGDLLESLARAMNGLERKDAPVKVPKNSGIRRSVQWIEPKLVAEIAFAEFTADGVVRHASFVGLREDKKPAEVKREEVKPLAEVAGASAIKISNPDRVIFPESGITKGELADYYSGIASIMLPWTANRPVSLVRCPQGRAKKCFFQKHDAGSFGEQVHHVDVREKDGSVEPYLYVKDADGLLACVQMGTIEFHGWGSRIEDIERPDRMIFDLDPDEGLDFEKVKKAATDLKRHLSDIGLVSFPMLTGGKGVHVVVPLDPHAQWPAVKDFSQRFALALAEMEPNRFTATMSKEKRKGRIFIDWLRNQRGATAVLPYGVRARQGGPVAAPIAWSELADIKKASIYTLRDREQLIERANGRALKEWGMSRQALPDR